MSMRLSNTIRPTEPSGVFALPCARGLWRRVSVHRRLCFETAADGSTNRLDRFTYDNYLCIARNHWHPGGTSATDRFVWDPTEPVATRPLVFYQPNTSPQLYAHDGNKNVSELVSADNGTISAHYEYASFGEVILSSGDLALINPFRFSSEYGDDALGLVYYNYRHYEPVTGRWLQRDMKFLFQLKDNSKIKIRDVQNLYVKSSDQNNGFDLVGLKDVFGGDLKEISLTYVSDMEGFDAFEFSAWINNIFAAILIKSPKDFNPSSKTSKCVCIKELLLISHGGYSDNGDVYINLGNASLYEGDQKFQISDAINGATYCSPCRIELRACNVGNSKVLTDRLRVTGCEIVLHNGLVNVFGEPVYE